MSKFSVWAYVSAGGCVLADSAWATEQDVWRIVLGWPGPEEIAEARRTGALVALCTLTVEDEAPCGGITRKQVGGFVTWCRTVGKFSVEKDRALSELLAAWERQETTCTWTAIPGTSGYMVGCNPGQRVFSSVGIGAFCRYCGHRI